MESEEERETVTNMETEDEDTRGTFDRAESTTLYDECKQKDLEQDMRE